MLGARREDVPLSKSGPPVFFCPSIDTVSALRLQRALYLPARETDQSTSMRGFGFIPSSMPLMRRGGAPIGAT